VLLKLQRDWTCHETYEPNRAIVVENDGGGYEMGLAYAREMDSSWIRFRLRGDRLSPINRPPHSQRTQLFSGIDSWMSRRLVSEEGE
jgi:hypothetical protein